MITLDTPLENIPRIPKKIVPGLKRLGIKNIRELLHHFPSRYDDFSNVKKISETVPGEVVTVKGTIQKISNIRTFRKRMVLTEAVIKDDSGEIRAIWFNQPFLAKNLRQGDRVNFSGKIAAGKRGKYFQNPAYEKIRNSEFGTESSGVHTGGLVAVYPETRGITSRWIRFLIKNFIGFGKTIEDPIPEETRKKFGFPRTGQAIFSSHFPKNIKDAESANRRFIFEELLLIQLRSLEERMKLKQFQAPAITLSVPLIKEFVGGLPFELTNAQRRTIWEIMRDISKPRPMNRLLEGDAGSGKTIVGAAVSLLTARAGYKIAFMAPTEILARQHFQTFHKLLSPFGIKVGLMVGAEKKVKKDTQVFIGTHALIQKKVKFENLGLVIIDEQHRFGVGQRASLLRDPNFPNTPELPERKTRENIIEKDLSFILSGIFFKIQQELGRFSRERQYADAVGQMLRMNNIPFQREVPIEVADRKSNFADFIINNKILLEIKAKPFLEKTDYFQTERYLETANIELGLIVNFRQGYLKPKRILNPKFDARKKFGTFGCNSDGSGREKIVPHFLSMSATPIPRTLALTIYGDLDLSILDEMPKSRKEIITKIIEPEKRNEAYEFIRREIIKGRQVFVICPRIDSSQTNAEKSSAQAPDYRRESEFGARKSAFAETKAVKEEYKKLSESVFPDFRVAMMHGKLKSKEKDEIMKNYRNRKTDILVSTSVIEVGVDIPNATVMMIEGAEKFGLAQLHQFRGRVGRGAEQSYCFLFTTDGNSTRRLRAVVDAKNGFELAEKDLEIRGAGELFGTRQWGVSRMAAAGITDAKLVREVRKEAVGILNDSPTLTKYPVLRARLDELRAIVHPE